MNNDHSFNYSYSAKQQEEIKAIRNKYVMPEQTTAKMEQLRRLDRRVSKCASVAALIPGTLGVLLLGSGMSLLMSPLWQMLKLSENTASILGVILGLIGIVLVCIAYPIYNRVIKVQRKKAAPEILRITDELLQE